MDKSILVSVFVTTYNQEKYIAKTLDGIISQITNFNFEVIVHDDCSTDNTKNIIIHYQKEYPNLIIPIFQFSNQYSKGLSANINFIYPRAKGKYFAFCEGDDYWCDNNKLQRQVDALEKNPQCSFCTHKTRIINNDDVLSSRFFPSVSISDGINESDSIIHIELVESPWLFHFSSFFLRKEVYDEYVTSFKEVRELFPVGDKPLLLFFLYRGNVFYINEEMSCYRLNCGVTGQFNRDISRCIANEARFIQGYTAFDNFSNFKYSKDINKVIHRKQANCLFFEGKYRELFTKNNFSEIKEYSLSKKIIVCLGYIFPKTVYRIYLKHKNKEG